MTRGMVLGKFLPPHLGHAYLVDFARAYADDLTVVVGTLAREPIPGELRVQWMRELFPTVRVVHLTDENPQYPHEHPDFWEIWKKSLLRVLPAPPDLVFASEAYGQELAQVLGASFVPVDLARTAVPISGTRVREAPMVNWEFLPRCVRPYFARRVCIFGPESTGKSTLAARLAAHYQTQWVPEYARTLLESRTERATAEDMPAIVRGQLASEEALARGANRLLFCDTDALTTAVWSEALFGATDPYVREKADAARYDLTLLTDVDVPFVQDKVRYLPDERESFFARAEEALRARGRAYVRLRGPWEERFAAACASVDALLARE
jgi:HTH-type transcriptional regulator, transcriptional repressor of NAD biosynthesis genes